MATYFDQPAFNTITGFNGRKVPEKTADQYNNHVGKAQGSNDYQNRSLS